MSNNYHLLSGELFSQINWKIILRDTFIIFSIIISFALFIGFLIWVTPETREIVIGSIILGLLIILILYTAFLIFRGYIKNNWMTNEETLEIDNSLGVSHV